MKDSRQTILFMLLTAVLLVLATSAQIGLYVYYQADQYCNRYCIGCSPDLMRWHPIEGCQFNSAPGVWEK